MPQRNALSLLTIICLVLAVAWWLAHPRSSLPRPSAVDGAYAATACVLPGFAASLDIPQQTPVPAGFSLPVTEGAKLTPLAGFSVQARVLGREDYRLGRESNFSPMDLALGWGRMRDDAVLSQLSISQGGRWYRYRWENQPPIPPDEIVRSSANMHMVPANADIASSLRRIKTGQHVRIDGWLIRIDATDGWRWVSSLSRDDSGNGACELVYVCAVSVR